MSRPHVHYIHTGNSFLMCQGRLWIPKTWLWSNCGISSPFVERQSSVVPSRRDSITEDVSIRNVTQRRDKPAPRFRKANLPSNAFCLSPTGPAPSQGWERRLRLSFCLAISSFWENKERGQESADNTHLHLAKKKKKSIRSNIHVLVDEPTHCHTSHSRLHQASLC